MTDTVPDLIADAAYGAILRQCRADPGEDLHRLALADRLEELGHAYAARRVRAEVALPTPHACEGQWVGTWWEGMPPLPRLAGVNAFYVTRRGLVEQVRCTLAEWIAHGSAVVRHPLAAVTAVTLTDRRPEWVDRDPGLPGWTLVTVGRNAIPYEIVRLAGRGWWETEADAAAGLSAALIRWAEPPF